MTKEENRNAVFGLSATMNGNSLFNDAPFDALVERSLGCYVYVLKDDGIVFYVGKGGGSGHGNARVLAHLEEAQRLFPSRSTALFSEKVKRIHKIWDSGRKVEWEIIRYALPDDEAAFQVEAALIDFIGRENLTNFQRGRGTWTSGRLASQDVYRLAAPMVAPTGNYKKVLIFNIEKGMSDGRSAYDATRKWWSRTRKHEDATHAVGLVRGVSYSVVEVRRWLSWDEEDCSRTDLGCPINYSGTDWEKDKLRRGFEGQCFIENGTHELLGKNFRQIRDQAKAHWGFGSWLAVEFNEGTARIVKGKGGRNSS